MKIEILLRKVLHFMKPSEEEKLSPGDIYSKYGIEPCTLDTYIIPLTNPRVLGRNIYLRTYPLNKNQNIDVYISTTPFGLCQNNFVMMLENFTQLKDLYKALKGRELNLKK